MDTTTTSAIKYDRGNYSSDHLYELYQGMLKPRLIEEKMLRLLRKGRISKWFSGIGQEAISVGATMAIDKDEFILPLHRNLGVFTSRNVPMKKLFLQFQGKKDGFSKGRERSFHFGATDYYIVGMISHLGPQLSIGAGIALAHKLRNEGKISIAFSGEGGTSEGEFHEALNVAAVWKLPVIFLIENNGYGLSTPVNEQYAGESIVSHATGYGMEGLKIDGNNILEVYDTISRTAESMRKDPRPVLIECMTFRMRGHEEASGTKYVPDELFETWGRKDPLLNFEQFLIDEGVLTREKTEALRTEIIAQINEALNEALAEPKISPSIEGEMNDIFAPTKLPEPVKKDQETYLIPPSSETRKEIRLVDAVSEGLNQSLERNANLIVMGQDVAEYGGVFKVTEGFLNKFGKDRIRNTPLCESAIVGIGLGLSVKGFKSVIEMQFADFVSVAFNQIVNNLAKIYYRWGQNADVVIRMPTGAGVGAGPFHSQSTEAWFFHVPGLKIVYPAFPGDAKGLLTAAIEDPNPVMFFEHKLLYRSVSAPVFEDYYSLPIGKGKRVAAGDQVSIITYGLGVHWALEAVGEFGDSALDIIDLRSLMPWDKDLVRESTQKTGKVLILHEDTLTGGIGAEISAWINENLFEYLDGPVIRVGSLDTPVPFAPPLEEQFLAKSRLIGKLRELINY